MSHEIRTPLNAIIGMSELLSMERLSPRQQNYVKDVSMASHSLLSIINDVLDFSKIEAGKLDLNAVDYDFHEFISNIVSMFRFMAQKKGLSFEYDAPDDLPKCLHGDDVRLRQVLVNICSNAVNYTNKGDVRFTAACTENKLIFKVQDTGIGIKPEDIKELFSPFMRVEAAKTRNVKGTGLGLPISKSFVDMMGGSIDVASEYGKGAVFIVTVPKRLGDESKIVRVAASAKNKVPFTAPEAKALVVDDNDLNLKVAFRLLSLYGIAVDIVPSGADAISAVKNTDYDIVFMDHMMPEMDGIQAAGKIREIGGKFAALPIIALTANATRGVRDIFLTSGLDDYLPKPIEIDKLGDMLKKWIPFDKIIGEGGSVSERMAARRTAENAARAGGSDGFWESVAATGFINAEIGKSRVAGIEEMYRETLDLFYSKIPRDCETLEKHLKNKDLPGFAILVHGIKSSLSTIGAMQLSESAFALEKASKEGDLPFCEGNTPPFIESLRGLRAKLGSICDTGDGRDDDRSKGDDVDLKEFAKVALTAAEAYDGEQSIEAIGKLIKNDYGDDTNKLLKDAQNALRNFEFGEAVNILKKILNV
jgi:CheY-like chemotaxis protein/anti-sigma regulatory factor (Ser/Thr protein kinase)